MRKKQRFNNCSSFTTTPLVALEFEILFYTFVNPTIDAYLLLMKDLDIEQIDDYSFIYKLKSKKIFDFTKNIIKKILKYEDS